MGGKEGNGRSWRQAELLQCTCVWFGVCIHHSPVRWDMEKPSQQRCQRASGSQPWTQVQAGIGARLLADESLWWAGYFKASVGTEHPRLSVAGFQKLVVW